MSSLYNLTINLCQGKGTTLRVRAPTELVQHSAYRGSSSRLNVASSYRFNMVWLYRSPIAVGREAVFTLLKLFYLLSRRLQEGNWTDNPLWYNSHTAPADSSIMFNDDMSFRSPPRQFPSWMTHLTLSKDDNKGHLFWEKPVEQETKKLE
jgi:hypothetical protein